MQWLDHLERRFGDWTIPQFPLFIVFANLAIYILNIVEPTFTSRLLLEPNAVASGEVWRIVTFLFVPPARMSPLWLILWLYVLYQYAQALENEWGEFKFCFFYLIGALATVIAALFIVHGSLDNTWLNLSLFLAFAALYPEFEILLFFVIPIRVKFLGWFAWIWIVFAVIVDSFETRVGIVASLSNYFLFFGPGIWETVKLKVQVYRNRRRLREGNPR